MADLRAFIERYPKMVGQDDVIHSIWVDKMDEPLECRVSDIKSLLDTLDKIKELHRSGGWQTVDYGTSPYCLDCKQDWPCRTALVLKIS